MIEEAAFKKKIRSLGFTYIIHVPVFPKYSRTAAKILESGYIAIWTCALAFFLFMGYVLIGDTIINFTLIYALFSIVPFIGVWGALSIILYLAKEYVWNFWIKENEVVA